MGMSTAASTRDVQGAFDVLEYMERTSMVRIVSHHGVVPSRVSDLIARTTYDPQPGVRDLMTARLDRRGVLRSRLYPHALYLGMEIKGIYSTWPDHAISLLFRTPERAVMGLHLARPRLLRLEAQDQTLSLVDDARTAVDVAYDCPTVLR